MSVGAETTLLPKKFNSKWWDALSITITSHTEKRKKRKEKERKKEIDGSSGTLAYVLLLFPQIWLVKATRDEGTDK